ncbi:MAG TPA: CPBP family intramembrane glutamic endopeptidase [Ktedonobacteraceae bacterium]|nr:CPBP family intramembrane glutamic endopeptidase [Ktedonobacteraceae bacterium]
MGKSHSRSWIYLGLYILLLFGAATIFHFTLAPLALRFLGENSIAFAFVEPLWKLLFWIMPMFLFLTYNAQRPVISYLKLDHQVKKGLAWGMIGSSFFVLRGVVFLLSGYHLILAHTPNDWLNSVLLVGIIEESIFRGFLYQWIRDALASSNGPKVDTIAVLQDEEVDELLIKLREWLPKRNEVWAALLSTFLFAAIHFPSWIALQAPLWLIMTSTAFNIFFGLVQCGLLKYSNSLWSCVIFHMMDDLVILLFQ